MHFFIFCHLLFELKILIDQIHVLVKSKTDSVHFNKRLFNFTWQFFSVHITHRNTNRTQKHTQWLETLHPHSFPFEFIRTNFILDNFICIDLWSSFFCILFAKSKWKWQFIFLVNLVIDWACFQNYFQHNHEFRHL